MEKDDLHKLINQFESSISESDAYFGIFQYGGGPDESYIKANKQGITLFALDLLKATLKEGGLTKNNENAIYPLRYDEEWIDENSHVFIQYFEQHEKKKEKGIVAHKEIWKDNAIKLGCISAFVFAIIAGVVGVITILKFIF